jgi:hypothetical protein
MKTKWSPAKTQYNSPGLLNYNFDAKELRQDNPGALLIWFNNIDRKFLFTIDELQTKIRTAKIAQFGDGGIYTIENK